MAAVRYGGVKLVVPFIGHTAGNTFPKRLASTSVSTSQNRSKLRAWSGQRGVKVPRKKVMPKNAVLWALKDSVAIDWRMNSLYPCETMELAPATVMSKKHSLHATQRAKESVELLSESSDLLTDGMSWVGETKAELDYIKLDEGYKATGRKTVEQIIDDLIAEQDLKKFHSGYQALIKDAEISSEMKEKVVASACFIAASVRNGSNVEDIKVLNEILNLNAPLTKSMLLVAIQCFVEIGNETQYKKWFELLLENGECLDSSTANSLLKISNASSLKSNVIDMLKSQEVPPTASGVMALFPYEDSTGLTTEETVQLLSKYIQEATQCSTNTEIEVLVEALCLVSTKLMNNSIMHALLLRMESFGNEKVQNYNGFVEAIVTADKLRDIDLAHKIVEAACRHCTSLPQKFFSTYVFCVGKLATPELFMENIAGYLGPVVNVNGSLFERIVNLCSRRQWPHVLPLLFSTFDNPVLNHKYYTSWLKCASKLVKKADEDCLIQFRSITDVLINFVKFSRDRSSPEFRACLVDLMVKCNHRSGLDEFLKLANKHPTLKKESAYMICETAYDTGT